MELINIGTILIITATKNEFKENPRITTNNLNRITSSIIMLMNRTMDIPMTRLKKLKERDIGF